MSEHIHRFKITTFADGEVLLERLSRVAYLGTEQFPIYEDVGRFPTVQKAREEAAAILRQMEAVSIEYFD